jgi:ABC-type Fe3+/spermidine/putrescine transport system ATPase subunit
MASIALVGVTKTFGHKIVLDNLSLDIQDGEFVALLGPSGSGKTTLLKIIAGLEPPSAGRVLFGSVDVTSVPSRRRGAIIVPQDHCLFPHMTVYDNVSFGLRARGESRQAVMRKVRDILNVIQLPDKETRYPHELSGGEKQRVALARACVVEPSVLLLDEPFSNLDTSLRLSMREFVVQLQRRLKFTCILVTHDKEEALVMSQRVAVLLDSRVEQVDTPEMLYSHPRNRKVAAFLGECNFIPGAILGGLFHCSLGSFPIPMPDAAKATGMWRYNHIFLSDSDGKIKGSVVDKTFAGRSTSYKVELTDGTMLTATSSNGAVTVGDIVSVFADEQAFCVYLES